MGGGACGMGILPMSDGLTQTHGQDGRATADIQTLPTIGKCTQRSQHPRNQAKLTTGLLLAQQTIVKEGGAKPGFCLVGGKVPTHSARFP